MSKILDSLYLGSYSDARNQVFLKKAGITHIVTVGVELQALFPQTYKYLYIPAYDHPSYQLAPYFDQIADFINTAIEKEKGTVFVHCQMGISRSTTSVIAYLVKYHRMHPVKAGLFVKARRAIVYPNPGFLYQLEGYAKKLGVEESSTGYRPITSSTVSNGFSFAKKEEESKKPEVKTLAMTSSAWKTGGAVKEPLDLKPAMTITSWKAALKEENKSIEADKGQEKDFSCKTCGTKLFNALDIEHDANTSSYCTTIYVKYMPWLGFSKTTTSKIYCPNGKCNTILGFCNQNGGKCPCGKRIERMYGLYPLKLNNNKAKMQAASRL